MAKGKSKDTEHVTQSQWAEGREMIKGFFGKMFDSMEELKKDVSTLDFEFKDFRKEQRQKNKEVEEKIEINTEAINLLSTKLQETQKLEFTVFKHGQRITALEKERQK